MPPLRRTSRDLGQVDVFGRVRRLRLRSVRRTSGRAAPAIEEPDLFARFTTPQLCALWRKSWSGLHGEASPATLARVAAARARLLDELERREPDAMADWLRSGALEPDGPSAYLVR